MSGNICSNLADMTTAAVTLLPNALEVFAWWMTPIWMMCTIVFCDADAEPNCGIEGVQGHWIKDTLNPRTYLELWRVMLHNVAALLPLYLVSHVPLGALCWISLAIVNARLHHPLIVESSKSARLIEQLVHKLICAIRLYLQI